MRFSNTKYLVHAVHIIRFKEKNSVIIFSI